MNEDNLVASNENIANTSPQKNNNYRPIDCDQVHLIIEALKRITPLDGYPRISRQRDMKIYACLYEIMEVAQLKFNDKSARWNGTPNDARDYESK